MADQQEVGQKKEERPKTGYYVFMGLVVVTLVIIVVYVIHSYLVG
jgi:cytochrome c1